MRRASVVLIVLIVDSSIAAAPNVKKYVNVTVLLFQYVRVGDRAGLALGAAIGTPEAASRAWASG